jgi:adenine-specific DNA-methyltransferase
VIELIQGDCLEKMKELADNSVDLILTDPPYYKVKNEQWDRQWENPKLFLSWLDKIAEQWQRILKPNGSLYCFTSPKMSARVEVMLGERFNVLTRITWDKEGTISGATHRRNKKEGLRAFVAASENIIFCEQYGADNVAKGEAGYAAKCDELRGFVFEPLRAYLAGEVKRAGFTTRRVAEAFRRKTGSRTVTGMAGHWLEQVQWALPTEANYLWLRDLLNHDGVEYLCREYEDLRREYEDLRREYEDLRREYEDLRREYEDLRREYEDLRREYEDLRRPFRVSKDVPYTDVWTFEPVHFYKGKHPCEKPPAMIEHIITASSRDGTTVLDCFMGTGSAGVAAKNLNRNFIGIELDPDYFRIAQARIDGRA